MATSVLSSLPRARALSPAASHLVAPLWPWLAAGRHAARADRLGVSGAPAAAAKWLSGRESGVTSSLLYSKQHWPVLRGASHIRLLQATVFRVNTEIQALPGISGGKQPLGLMASWPEGPWDPDKSPHSCLLCATLSGSLCVLSPGF
jgi:hypothetical protein